MTRQEIDSSFTALPYRRMGEAALTRAQDFHVSHADFRFERIRSQSVGVRDGRLQGASDTEDIGFAVRVVLNGAWGFASGVVLNREAAIGVAETAVRVAQVAAAMTLRAGGAGRRAGVPRRRVGLGLRGRPVLGAAGREGGAAVRLVRRPGGRARRRALLGLAAPGRGEQVLHRPRGHHDHPAAGPPPARGGGVRQRRVHRRLRLDAHDRPAGRPRLGVPHRRVRLGRRARRAARPARREARRPHRGRRPLRPGDPPVQPLADHPRVRSGTPPSSTGRSATRPTTRVRRSRPWTSSGPCSTAPRS